MREAMEHALILHNKIRIVLMDDWDPIGIQKIPSAQDEYDIYVSDIYSMLVSRKSVDEVLKYLLWIEVDRMGLTANRQRAKLIAEKLVSLE